MNNTKKNIILMLVLTMLGIFTLVGCGKSKTYDYSSIKGTDSFLGCDIGCSKDTVLNSEKNTLSKEMNLGDNTLLNYNSVNIDGNPAKVIYVFDSNNKLIAGMIYYVCDENETEAMYKQLAKKCSDIYGNNKIYIDNDSIHWKIGDNYSTILKNSAGTKLIYTICTKEYYYQIGN